VSFRVRLGFRVQCRDR